MKYFLPIMIAVMTAPLSIAYASCSTPAAEAGVLIFNVDHKVMQYCNGDVWVGMGGAMSGGGARITGEIAAFELTACPDGWSEYTPARGRFLRGIDNGAGNDPSGTRSPGDVQADDNKAHSHTITDPGHRHSMTGSNADNGDPGSMVTTAASQSNGTRYVNSTTTGITINESGSSEARPKNVAVLYCRKD